MFGLLRNLRVRRQRILVMDALGDVVFVRSRVPIMISRVTPENVDRVMDFRGERCARIFRRHLREGQYGVYAWRRGGVVGHAWANICEEGARRVNGYMDLSEGEALIHFCNVSKQHRGANIYPAILATLCRTLFCEKKVRRILIDTGVHNEASLRGIAKVGFQPLGTGLYIQFRDHLLFKWVVRSRRRRLAAGSEPGGTSPGSRDT